MIPLTDGIIFLIALTIPSGKDIIKENKANRI